jgi:hypothetical protein
MRRGGVYTWWALLIPEIFLAFGRLRGELSMMTARGASTVLLQTLPYDVILFNMTTDDQRWRLPPWAGDDVRCLVPSLSIRGVTSMDIMEFRSKEAFAMITDLRVTADVVLIYNDLEFATKQKRTTV